MKDADWYDYGASSDAARIQYGYDRASNRTYRYDVVSTAQSKTFDELYAYDGLHRLQDMGRGTLNGGKTALTTETFAQCWTLDETGNWAGFRQDGTGSGWDLIQARTANEVNEITDIDNTVGASWATPAYDPAGNMTTIPTANPPGWSDMSVADWSGLSLDNWASLPVDGSPDTYTATYDAWNRLVKLVDTSSTNTIAEYEYDARLYRTVVKSYVSGSLNETRHVYYTDSWQAIEERLGTETNPDRQYLWGLRYIDDLILRDRDTNANATLDERLYALQDGNWNVIALTDENGDVQERYAYTAYGVPVFLSASFATLSSSNFDWETLYCGYRWDTGTEIYAVRNRYLQPTLGKWITRDSVTDDLYLYVESNPIHLTDPEGLQRAGLHHFNPLYLGGRMDQPVGFLDDIKHPAAQNYLRTHFPYGNVGRDRWKLLTANQQRNWITRSMRIVGIPEATIRANINAIMHGAKPGIKTPRVGPYGKTFFPIGVGGLIAADLIFPTGVAQAAEQSMDWRNANFKYSTCKKTCECAIYSWTRTIPSWWAVMSSVEATASVRVSNWDDMGEMVATECWALEGIFENNVIEEVVGYTIYEFSGFRCKFGGES